MQFALQPFEQFAVVLAAFDPRFQIVVGVLQGHFHKTAFFSSLGCGDANFQSFVFAEVVFYQTDFFRQVADQYFFGDRSRPVRVLPQEQSHLLLFAADGFRKPEMAAALQIAAPDLHYGRHPAVRRGQPWQPRPGP